MTPICELCASPLMKNPEGWVCPTCGFYYVVRRGRAGVPLLKPPEGIAEERPKTAEEKTVPEETFEEWLTKHGVTVEMYNDADKRTKEDLKTAFYQRHLKEPDVALFPPQ